MTADISDGGTAPADGTTLSDTVGTTEPVQTFEGVVTRFRRPLTAAAYHLVGDMEAALDIVQDTLIDAYSGFSSLRDPERAGAWLYAILRRKAFSHYRTRKCETELSADLPAPSDEELEGLTRAIVVEQLGQLPETDREILAGKYLLGLSYRELAESLGMKEANLRVRCLRAKERLRSALRGTGVEDE